MRPLGALVFGRIGDRIGRKYTFLVTLVIMGATMTALGGAWKANESAVLVTGLNSGLRKILILTQYKARSLDRHIISGWGFVSRELREVADNYFSGFLLPDLVPVAEEDRRRGYLHTVNEERYFGFVTVQTGLGPGEVENNIFLHGNDLEGAYSNEELARLVGNHIPIEFSTISDSDGRRRAVKAKRLSPEP